MKEEKSVMMGYFGDTPILRIIDFLLENRLFDYSKKQIIDETGLAKATFYKYWDRLLELGIVKVTRSFRRTNLRNLSALETDRISNTKTKLYKLNEKSPIIRELKRLELALIESTSPTSAPKASGY